jgi:hypothetical protein
MMQSEYAALASRRKALIHLFLAGCPYRVNKRSPRASGLKSLPSWSSEKWDKT